MSPFEFVGKINIDFDAIIAYLLSEEIQKVLLPVQIASLLIFGTLIGIIIFILSRTHYMQWLFIQDAAQFLTMRPFGAKKITRYWNKITARLNTGSEFEYKLAIIEADDLLDSSLKKMGYGGPTLEEKLGKLTSVSLPDIEQVFAAHRLRNNIVHDPDFRLTLEEARKIVNIYGKAFNDLQILEK